MARVNAAACAVAHGQRGRQRQCVRERACARAMRRVFDREVQRRKRACEPLLNHSLARAAEGAGRTSQGETRSRAAKMGGGEAEAGAQAGQHKASGEGEREAATARAKRPRQPRNRKCFKKENINTEV